jgi:hypothetical protein
VKTRARLLGLLAAAWCLLAPGSVVSPASAQDPGRDARFEWDPTRRFLYVSVGYRDVVDDKIKQKLNRGLPTTILMTGTLYRSGGKQAPLSTTAQSCKITFHVWEEAYRIEILQPGLSRVRWTPTVEGVLRRCAEATKLLAATRQQVPQDTPVYLGAKVQINPISAEVLQKIKRWVSRPSGTSTAAPGDAVFSTFTGLFLQRIGEAERELKFNTKLIVPTVLKAK